MRCRYAAVCLRKPDICGCDSIRDAFFNGQRYNISGNERQTKDTFQIIAPIKRPFQKSMTFDHCLFVVFETVPNAQITRLFSYISINCEGKPLATLSVIIGLINGTVTKNGLTVKAQLDSNLYQTGIKIDDNAFAKINIERNSFHGEWNYMIIPS
jgi:hypothetical protein